MSRYTVDRNETVNAAVRPAAAACRGDSRPVHSTAASPARAMASPDGALDVGSVGVIRHNSAHSANAARPNATPVSRLPEVVSRTMATAWMDTFTLTGTQVWALLAQQLAPGTGGIMQVSGLKFSYSGTTITSVTLADGTPIPNDDSKTYTGTANSFMMGGGDGFTVLKSASNVVQTADAELVPLVDYVASLSNPFTYTTDNRITKS